MLSDHRPPWVSDLYRGFCLLQGGLFSLLLPRACSWGNCFQSLGPKNFIFFNYRVWFRPTLCKVSSDNFVVIWRCINIWLDLTQLNELLTCCTWIKAMKRNTFVYFLSPEPEIKEIQLWCSCGLTSTIIIQTLEPTSIDGCYIRLGVFGGDYWEMHWLVLALALA